MIDLSFHDPSGIIVLHRRKTCVSKFVFMNFKSIRIWKNHPACFKKFFVIILVIVLAIVLISVVIWIFNKRIEGIENKIRLVLLYIKSSTTSA